MSSLPWTPHPLERLGCPLHYWLGGPEERPVVVLLHGAAMDHRMWEPQAEALLPDYRVLAVDQRGHGRSQPQGDALSLERYADDALAILDAIGARDAAWVGQSFGGLVAQQVARQAPERVRAMAVIGSTPLAKAYSRVDVLGLRASLPLLRLWPYSAFLHTMAASVALRPEVQAYALEAAGQIPRRDFLRIWEAVSQALDHVGDPGLRIDAPLLLMHGDHDQAGTVARDMPAWAEAEPQARYVVIPDAGHNANQDNPLATNRALLPFLAEALG